MSAPIATPPQFSANRIRLCRLVIITNDSTWKRRVRYPMRKQKKQTKQTTNQNADSSGSDAMKNSEKIRGKGRPPQHGVVRDQPRVAVEVAQPGDPPQQVADQDERQADPPERRASAGPYGDRRRGVTLRGRSVSRRGAQSIPAARAPDKRNIAQVLREIGAPRRGVRCHTGPRSGFGSVVGT